MSRHVWCKVLLATMGVLMGGSALAQSSVPEPLRTWTQWAAEPFAYRQCALLPGQTGRDQSHYACSWPSRLEIEVSDNGGSFRQHWQLQHPASIPLPGSQLHWPQDVQVNGRLVPVADRDGVPTIHLSAGRFQVSGSWKWDQLPASLDIPSHTAWWQVQGVPDARRQGGRIQLAQSEEARAKQVEEDTASLRVFRRFVDGQVPIQEVWLDVSVGGADRQITLGPLADPAKWVPLGFEGRWPARWQEDGTIQIQAQPGNGVVRATLRCQANCETAFSRPSGQTEPWPALEYWALETNPGFRVVAWEGAGIDPAQAGVPGQWQSLPWISVPRGGSAQWAVRSRGPTQKDPAMSLSRTGWLDFSGKGWWMVDEVHATRGPSSGRLEAAPGYVMHAASQSGAPLLVSMLSGKRTGAEWRSSDLMAKTVLRREGMGGVMAIPGLEGEFSNVQWTLHLPAAHNVLFAPGADNATGVWWNAWRLTQVLGVALILILCWRWGQWRMLLPAAGLLLLSFHSGVPVWSWGFALGASLLACSGLPQTLHRPAVWMRRIFIACWLFLAVLFAVSQVKLALYPDSEHFPEYGMLSQIGGRLDMHRGIDHEGEYFTIGGDVGDGVPVVSRAAAPAPAMEAAAAPPVRFAQEDKRSIEETPVSVSAGPGLPHWQGNRKVRLEWQGPLTHNDTIKLWIAGPVLVVIARWLSVVLLAMVAWSLLVRPRVSQRGWRIPWPRRMAVSLLALCVTFPAMAAPAVKPEELPPEPSVLHRLGESVYPVPACAPACTAIANVRVEGSSSALVVRMQAHAQARTALAMPEDEEGGLVLSGVSVNGVAQPLVLRTNDASWLHLDEGVHEVVVQYLARSASGSLRFPLQPRLLEIGASSGWSFQGIARNRLDAGVLGWSRVISSQPAQGQMPAQDDKPMDASVKPFVRIHRSIVLGARWEVSTRVERVAPSSRGFVVMVPLIEGEAPRRDMKRSDGKVEVVFVDNQQDVSWKSDLPASSRLVLEAPAQGHVEQWSIQAGTRFNVKTQGLPPVSDANLSFMPIPGERLEVQIVEPAPVGGSILAVDEAKLSHSWGPRGQSMQMSLSVRATTAADLVVSVPQGVDLVSIQRNGQIQPGMKVENGKLSLPVPPGNSQWDLSWRNAISPSLRVGTAGFSVNAPVANLSIEHSPGDKRWLLATPGPGRSPSVAYWPWLTVLIGIAVLLGRWKKSPLSITAWVLLGLGFSVGALWKFLAVGGWLVAMRWRQENSRQLHESRGFDLIQVGLLALTALAVVAMISALPSSLLYSPDMIILGQQRGYLTWFIDQLDAGQSWAGPTVYSLPMWAYRWLMLAWCLWLAINAVGWMRAALAAWLDGGWRKRKTPPPLPPQG